MKNNNVHMMLIENEIKLKFQNRLSGKEFLI